VDETVEDRRIRQSIHDEGTGFFFAAHSSFFFPSPAFCLDGLGPVRLAVVGPTIYNHCHHSHHAAKHRKISFEHSQQSKSGSISSPAFGVIYDQNLQSRSLIYKSLISNTNPPISNTLQNPAATSSSSRLPFCASLSFCLLSCHPAPLPIL
jgi:hypothetical protein